MSLAFIEEQWVSLVQALESKKKSIGIFFREGKPVAFEGDLLTIGFPAKNKFHREILESQSHRKLIEETLGDSLKQKIRIAFDTLKEEAPPAKETFVQDPIVKFSIDVFNGDVVKNE